MRWAAPSAWRRPSSERCSPGARPGSFIPVVGVAPWRTSKTAVGRARVMGISVLGVGHGLADDTAAPAPPQAGRLACVLGRGESMIGAPRRPDLESPALEGTMSRTRKGCWLAIGALVLLALSPRPADAQKKTLVIALNEDPDILDPTPPRSEV